MKKKLVTFLLSLGLFVSFGLLSNSNNAEAAAYGGKLYTTPKALRGTWYFAKAGKNDETDISQLNISTYTRRLKLLLIQLRLPNGKELDCRAVTLFIKVLKNCLLRK